MTAALLEAILALVLVVGDFVVRVLSVIFIPRNRRPQTALAWPVPAGGHLPIAEAAA